MVSSKISTSEKSLGCAWTYMCSSLDCAQKILNKSPKCLRSKFSLRDFSEIASRNHMIMGATWSRARKFRRERDCKFAIMRSHVLGTAIRFKKPPEKISMWITSRSKICSDQKMTQEKKLGNPLRLRKSRGRLRSGTNLTIVSLKKIPQSQYREGNLRERQILEEEIDGDTNWRADSV